MHSKQSNGYAKNGGSAHKKNRGATNWVPETDAQVINNGQMPRKQNIGRLANGSGPNDKFMGAGKWQQSRQEHSQSSLGIGASPDPL